MYKARSHTIFILSCFAIFNLNLTNAVDSKFVRVEDATEEDVNSLRQVSAKEALPVVLFGTKQSTEMVRPTRLTEVEIRNGRLASGTQFAAKSSDPQMFFCPNKHDAQKCLAEKNFKESQVLECEIEPKPILQERPVEPDEPKKRCGNDGNADQLMFVYKICNDQHIGKKFLNLLFNKSTNVKAEPVYIYSICYDKTTKKVMSAYHNITDAAMLSEKLLTRERQIKFEIDTENYDELVDESYYTDLKAEAQSKPQYKLQQLMLSANMALAWRIKPTYHFTNYALQHEELIEPWNHIHSLIRTHAEYWYPDEFGLLTGVIDIPEDEISAPVDENQKMNIWVSIVAYTSEESAKELAIMMNNFIEKPSKNQGIDKGAGTPVERYIDKICGKDRCADSLKEVFNKVGGQVRCCQVTRNIMNLFFPAELVDLPDQVLHIANLTNRSL